MNQVSDLLDQRMAAYVMTTLNKELEVWFPDAPKPPRGTPSGY